ncbi:MAG TPA: argininosuccinate lyase [Pirellulaceae bacterium]
MASPSRSGVFRGAVDQRVEHFAESISFDERLWRQDLQGSLAHARMLAEVGLLTADDIGKIERGLQDIQGEWEAGGIPHSIHLEDVHMHIEQALSERLGDVGRKLHTGRSRNDQIATDMRLWCREAIDRTDLALRQLQSAFVSRCDRDAEIIVPAYTHLRRAQPVLANHYWLAYCERWQRDRERLADVRRRTNISVLGVAAVAGTSLPIDRHATARALGFDDVARNSLDASSDRDFLLEFAFALSLIAIHLSGWAEEWILWSTEEFGFLHLPEEFCTGSSIMPQKINPDVLELIRGRTARAIGALQALCVLTKGLPLAYHRDLQEDKVHIFAAFDSVCASLEIAEPVVRLAELRRERIAARLEEGFLDATTLMEYMILRGVPQRTAHHVVGQIVQSAMDRGIPLARLPLEELQVHSPAIEADVFEVLGPRNAVAAFRSYGSTCPTEVQAQLQFWKQRIHSL